MNEPGTTGNGRAARGGGGKTLSPRAQARPARVAPEEGPEEPGQLIRPLAMRAMFMRPAYLAQSAWLEHVPFAFWLVEAHQPGVIVELGTHHGVSYFALCQAVERLGLATRCYAVDSWKGDAHAGFYGEEVFEQVRAHNDAHYSGFSRLVRSSFDEALDHFSDGTIDLLHIDGLHTIEAVRHDFESWLPKLSERAVVMLHDSNVRERDFGVFRLVEQLRERYPCFEFVHGHGLAVLGVGVEQSAYLERLFAVSGHEAGRRAVQEMFARLGRATADAYAAQARASTGRALEVAMSPHKTERESLDQALDRANKAMKKRDAKMRKALARVESQAGQHAAERGRLDERATLLLELRDESRREAARLSTRADQATAELKERTDALIALQATVQEHQRLLGEARGEVTRERDAARAAREELGRYREMLATARADLAAKQEALNAVQAELEQAGTELEAAQHECSRTHGARRAAQADLERARRTTAAVESELESTRMEVARQGEMAEKAQFGLEAERRSRAKAEQALEKERTEAADAAKRHREELAEQESRLRGAETDRDRFRAEAESATRSLEERVSELARLTRLLQETEGRVEEREQQLDASRKETAARVEQREQQLDESRKETAARIEERDRQLDESRRARHATARLLGQAIVALGRYSPERPPRAATLRRLGVRLKEAGVLDPDWYLECNRDVSEAGLDPVRHYLLDGVREGREPRDVAPLLGEPEHKEAT